jgi:hypothetical protein
MVVWLIHQSMHALIAGADEWVVPVVIKDFQLGMSERLAKAIRKLESLVSLALQVACALRSCLAPWMCPR